ncbi:MAG: NUDIX domain-containing protein [Chloroflexales bacterium]|nr:NUDIX domain-containing protein [Chloroflexales bacterium]
MIYEAMNMFAPNHQTTIYVNARALIERQTHRGFEVVLQTRNKAHENKKSIELPGGRLDLYESFIDALKREVKEETGLGITFVEGQSSRLETVNSGNRVECLRPYAVYQTLAGPVDSMGVYFLCYAEGELLSTGDDTEDIRWFSISEVAEMLRENHEQFSWVDQAALTFYLAEKGLT